MSLERNYESLVVAANNFRKNLDSILVGEELFYYAVERGLLDVNLILDPKFPSRFYKLVLKDQLDFSSAEPKELSKIQVNAILLSTKTTRAPKAITLDLPDSHPSKERLVALFKKYPEYDSIRIEATYSVTY